MALDPRDPRVQRLLRERELAAEAEARDEESRLAEEEDSLAKRLKIAEAIGLSEAEKEEYLAKEAPSLKTKVAESPVPSSSGIGPFAEGSKYKAALGIDAKEQKPTTIADKLGLGDKKKQDEKPNAVGETGARTMLDAAVGLTTSPKPAASELAKGREIEAAGAPVIGEAPKPVSEEKPAMTLQERIAQSYEGLGKEKEAAGKEREESMRRTEFGELASLVGRSLAQIGAAAQGMRAGVDMSGVGQQALVDWEKKRDRIDGTYQTKLASIAKEREQLLQQEQDAIKAQNDAKLLDLKQKEYKLTEKETAAKINKYNAETDAVRKTASATFAPQLTESQQQTINRELPVYQKAKETYDKSLEANERINKSIDAANKAPAGSTAADDRVIITSFLTQLDPNSAVLAAEYADASGIGQRDEILKAVQSGNVDAIKAWVNSKITTTLTNDRREKLREAANRAFAPAKARFHDSTRQLLRRSAEAGIPSPTLIIGREPAPEELDEFTSKRWGVAPPAEKKQQMETPPADSSTKQPTVNLPNIKAFGSADEALKALQSRGK